MIVTAFFAVLVVNGVSAEHVRVIAKAKNGEKIPVDITVQDGYVITVSGQPNSPQPFFKQSVNLYDFQKHLEARKVIGEGRCYIRNFRGTYSQMKKVVHASNSINYKMTPQASEDWNIPGKEIKDSELAETVGSKIAEFCSGYRVFWVNRNKRVTKLQVLIAKRQLNGTAQGSWNPISGFSVKSGLSNGRFGAHLGGDWNPGSRPSLNGELSYKNDKGLSADLSGTWKHKESSVNGGLKYDNGKGFSTTVGGSWNQGLGSSATVGLTWKFGGGRRGRGRGK